MEGKDFSWFNIKIKSEHIAMNYLYDICFDFVLNGKNYLLSLYSFNLSPLPPTPTPTHPCPHLNLLIYSPLYQLLTHFLNCQWELEIWRFVMCKQGSVEYIFWYVMCLMLRNSFVKNIVICSMLFIYCYYTVHIHVCYQRARLVYISLMHILYVYYFHLWLS